MLPQVLSPKAHYGVQKKALLNGLLVWCTVTWLFSAASPIQCEYRVHIIADRVSA
jgi:hypothetical protein